MSTWLDIWFGRFLMLAAMAFFFVMGIEAAIEFLSDNNIVSFVKFFIDGAFAFWLIDLGEEYEKVPHDTYAKQLSSGAVAITAFAETFRFLASSDLVSAIAFTSMSGGFLALSRHWQAITAIGKKGNKTFQQKGDRDA